MIASVSGFPRQHPTSPGWIRYTAAPTALSGTSPKSDEPQSDLGEAGGGAFTPVPATGKQKGETSFSETHEYVHHEQNHLVEN
jgi:hypothetical protein